MASHLFATDIVENEAYYEQPVTERAANNNEVYTEIPLSQTAPSQNTSRVRFLRTQNLDNPVYESDTMQDITTDISTSQVHDWNNPIYGGEHESNFNPIMQATSGVKIRSETVTSQQHDLDNPLYADVEYPYPHD